MTPALRRSFPALVVVVTAAVAACTQPSAARLCEAIEAGDLAAAQKALAAGDTDMLRQQGLCHPVFNVLYSRAASAASRQQILQAMFTAGLDPNATMSRSGSSTSGPGNRRSSTTTHSLVEWAADDAAIVELLLGAGLDTKTAGAGRAVASAAGSGTLDVVRLLVEAGASVNEPLLDQYGLASPLTALGRAIAGRHHEVITYLESKGARPDAGPVSPIFEAARTGDVTGVQRALAAGAAVDAVDAHEQTPLLRAAGFGQTAVVSALAAAKADVNLFKNGESALQAAATEGHAGVIRELVKAGARVNGRYDDHGRTPLLQAVQARRHAAVAALVDAGADVNLADGGGTTPLATAVAVRDLVLVQSLLRGKPNLAAIDGVSGLPVLHLAVSGCDAQDFDIALLRTLVAAGADVRAADTEGRTPRQRAEASLQGEARPFYKACYEARVAALKALGG